MLDTHRLRLLKEFAERGTIAATAAALGYTPSAVSQQLAALEREAGVALLDRTARTAELTDAGRRLAAHAERILALVEAAEADLSAAGAGRPGGGLRLPDRRRGLRARRWPARCGRIPGLTLLLRQTPRGEGLRQVRTGEVDVALSTTGPAGCLPYRAGGAAVLPPDRRPAGAGRAARAPGPPTRREPVDLQRAARRAVAGRAGRRAVPAGRGPAAGRRRRRAARRRGSSRAWPRSSAWSPAASGSPRCPGWRWPRARPGGRP